MAQLDIERKSHNSMWWLWLLIALIVVLALWWFVWGGGQQRDTVGAIPADSAATVVRATDPAGAATVVGPAGATSSFVTMTATNAGGGPS